MAAELRPYQAAAERPIRQGLSEHRRILVVSPTGSGKGVQIAWMSGNAAAKGRRVMIVVHRVELVRQTIAALAAMGIPAAIIAAGVCETPEILVQAALVTSLVRPQRLARWAGWAPNLVIVDEAHHLVAKSWQTIIEIFPQAFTVGFTATPLRLDGKGLGRIFGGMVVVATVKELIADGWLSPVRHYAPALPPDLSGVRVRGGDYVAEDAAQAMRRPGLVGDAIAHYQRHCKGGSAIVYASTIKHSLEIVEQFRAAGVAAQHIDANTPKTRRAAAIAALEQGELRILSNVNLFTEGLDLPALAGVIMLRPTQSLGLYLQMCGRALRVAPGKAYATIIDHAGNAFAHGLADEDHLWSLADRTRRKTATAAAKRCPDCGAVVAPAVRRCPECGCEFAAAEREPATVAGDLALVDPAEMLRLRLRAMSLFRQREWAGADYHRLTLIAELRGYRPGWAFYEQRRALEEEEMW